jgi:uncharacterized OB-fold protein
MTFPERNRDLEQYMDFSKGPLPLVGDEECLPFWEGTRRGEIRFPKCQVCNRFHWYPCTLCPFCYSPNIKWQALTSQARLFTWAYVKWNLPAYGIRGPFVMILVEFDEAPGLYLTSDLIECRPENVRIGMPLQVVFQRINNKLMMPLFKPVNNDQS